MDHVPAEYASPIRFAAAALPFAPTAVSTFAAAAAGRLGDSVRSATTSAKGPLEPELESSLPVGGHLGPAEGRVSPPSEKEASSSVMTAEKVAEKAAEKAAVVTAGVELASYSFLGDLLSQFTDADSASTPLLLVLSLLLLPLLQFADRLHREATNGSSSSSGVGSGRTSRAPIVSALVAMVALVAASGASTGAGPSALLSGLGQSLPLSTPWPLLACLLSLVSLLRCEAHCTCFDPLSLTAVQTSSLASLSLFSSLLFHLLSSSSSSAFPHGILPIITDAAAAAAHAGPAVPSTAALLPLIYSGLMCSGLGTWMEMKCLQDMPAPALMLVFTSIPIWGGLLSALAQGEVPEIGLGVAGLVIAAVNAGAWAVMSRNGDGAASGHAEKASGSANSSGNSSSTVDSNGSYTPQNNMPGAEEDASVSKVPVEQVSNALVASQLKVPFYSAKAKSVLLKLKLKAKVAGAKVLGGKVGVKAVAASAYSASHALTSAVGSGSFGAGTADAAAAAAAAAAGGTVDALSSLGGGMEISSFVSSSNMPLVHHVPKVMLSVLPVAPDQLLSSVHLHDVLHVVPSSLHHFIH
ncbi:hypothetical protein CLOM_g13538 [Closterium sp. NIES-68]|nr:hypothetical protein CLOM_g13538 [Closterium sp. NIES-68]